jgi:hypothetical protein
VTAWRPTRQAALPSADQAAEIACLQQENERLRMERDIQKRPIANFACEFGIRFRFIENRRADYPVTALCEVLRVSPAGYYA